MSWELLNECIRDFIEQNEASQKSSEAVLEKAEEVEKPTSKQAKKLNKKAAS
jgi:hypothetical protein